MAAAARRARPAPRVKSRINSKTKPKPKSKPKPKPIAIDVLVESTRWNDFADAVAIVRGAVMEAAAVLSTPRAELAIVLSDDSAVRELNRTWRGVDAATNVLSFPTGRVGGNRPHLGDIVLAFETIAAEAETQDKPFGHHLSHLAVHGFLHLAGYDHRSHKDAAVMEQLERNILQHLAIPDPYRQPAKPRI